MTESQRCKECGAELPPNAPQGICPQCLMKIGMDSAADGASTDANAEDEIPTAPTPSEGRFTPPEIEDLAPHFPQLEILELLGFGGMGVVYKARQVQLERSVALKILAPHVSEDPAFAERFRREARALAKLNHPHIVAVHESGQTDDGLYYFVMEYVDGTNLRQVLKTGELSPAEALTIVPQICDALQYAHDEAIMHRDIKPENILLDKKGRVKIADFGLGKLLEQSSEELRLTGTRDVMGTVHYMAPEQVETPQDVDHRADIYALGVVFYEMLTGELPLGRFSPPSEKVQVDVRIDEVVLKTLAKEPQRRYQHASEVKTDVERIGSGQLENRERDAAASPGNSPRAETPVTSGTATPPRSYGAGSRAWKLVMGIALLSLTGAVITLGALLTSRVSEPPVETIMLSLENSSVAGIEETLIETIRGTPDERRLSIATNLSTNTLILTGPGELVSKYEELVQALDSSEPVISTATEILETEIFEIEHADVVELMEIIQPRIGGVVSVEPRSNRLVVTDVPEGVEAMRELVHRLDVPTESENPGETIAEVMALTQEGWALFNAQKPMEAQVKFEEALNHDPKSVDALNGLGFSLLNTGNPKEAKQYFEQALRLEPGNPGVMNGMARSLKEGEGKVAEAVEIWERMVEDTPGPHAGTVALAWTYLELEEFEKAIAYFEQILEAAPNDANAQDGLARARKGLER